MTLALRLHRQTRPDRRRQPRHRPRHRGRLCGCWCVGLRLRAATPRRCEETRIACGPRRRSGSVTLPIPTQSPARSPWRRTCSAAWTLLVNNGSAFARGDDESGWNAAFSVDMMGVVRTNAAAIPVGGGRRRRDHQHRLDLRLSPHAPCRPFGAIKAAIVHYTASQALALAGRNVRVNAVAPGAIHLSRSFLGRSQTRRHRGLSPHRRPDPVRPPSARRRKSPTSSCSSPRPCRAG